MQFSTPNQLITTISQKPQGLKKPTKQARRRNYDVSDQIYSSGFNAAKHQNTFQELMLEAYQEEEDKENAINAPR